MKKLFLILVIAISAITANAQQSNSPVVVRNGDIYLTEEGTLDKRAFMGYLQSRDAVSYNSFRSAYRLANTGWGLFGGGIGLEIAGLAVILGGSLSTVNETNSDVAAQTVTSSALAGYGMALAGGALNTAGIVCIAVGYARMHQTADNYSVLHARQQPAVAFALQSSRDGIGFAIQF